MMMMSFILTEPEPEITEFSTYFGIYYDDVGTVSMLHTTNWKLVIYYDLSEYNQEVIGFEKKLEEMEKLCVTIKTIDENNKHCPVILHEFKISLSDIRHNDEIIRPNPHPRKGRSLIDAGGTLLHYMFGVLDKNSADEYDQHIKSLEADNTYLLELIRNQTLIIDISSKI